MVVFTKDALPSNAAAASVLVGTSLAPADASSFGHDSALAASASWTV